MAAITSADGAVPEKGLVKGTNWWGAFVIGLAGTILVTGIAPYVVQGTATRAGRGAAGLVGRPDQPGRRPPGPRPRRRERDEQVAIVDRAITDLERLGCTADGQVTATRSAGRAIAKAARARGVSYVVMDAVTATGIRRVMEGELTAVVRRGLRGAAELDVVDASLVNGH